ncbi:probable G-protein coupled receptor 149 [Megalobrama amblycephala]|uniref:probable G-protein coupled receptor 149 n=1 Tax=Megalobrama amblycephala TaxID=75352 RepID=UPI00201436B5|nr:probable G-protein coupled receptor 149 [Megalobrama amblycephala]
MSAIHASPLPNKTSQYEDVVEGNWHLLFGLSFAIATVTCLGGLYSLMSLLRMRSKSSLCLIVASLSIDDLISVVPLTLFMILQWRSGDANRSGAMCTLSGLLYVFQGLSSNMKACLIVAYTFYVTKRFGVYQTPNRPLGVFVAVVAVWTLSLAVSVLPVCGWGRFAPASLGCLPENDSLYALLLFSVYSLCFCGLVVCSVPLVYHLMCSTEALRTFYPGYFEIAGSAPLCEIPSLSRDSLEKSLGAYNELNSNAGSFKNKTEMYSLSYSPATGHFQKDGAQSARHSPVFFSQKRFSMILAMARMVLWMPMMTQILVSHAVHMHSSSLETLCFFLTLLSSVVTPVFVLSERWIHLPCGCFINCRQGLRSEISTAKERRFEFNLSFQQSYGIYKIPHAKSPSIEKPSFNSLYSCDFSESRVAVLDSGQIGKFSTTAAEDSSLHGELLLEERADSQPPNAIERDRPCNVSPQISTCDREDLHLDNSVFDGPERRLSHEECRKIELTDWEWCRSKSERTPRQRSTAGLAIPLCAFQGTVSLHAPTGKTLSLSTYEVSSDGLKISPNNAKKVEVYRSKSVGHEPSAEEPNSSTGGGGVGVADTNVKIHLEVLEICDNEEAMDSVSIVSNISQSSTHARSPSLRYSRRENRFVSCDLAETASYSLLIPTSNPDTDNINIHIPDTVEAHRQNSRRQHQEAGGYQEEIQLLNEAYRRQEGDQGN